MTKPSPWRNAVVVASGPSLTPQQCSLIAAARANDRCRVMVVNTTFRALPDADCLYACDDKWWRAHIAEVDRAFIRGELWTTDEKARDGLGICWLGIKHRPGLSRDPLYLHSGGNSGYQAINLAFHWGARRILLVGFDMRRTDGRSHWHGDHPRPLSNPQTPETWVRNFTPLADDLVPEGVEVINCTPGSALGQFPRADLAATLAAL